MTLAVRARLVAGGSMEVAALLVGFVVNLATIMMHVSVVILALPWLRRRAQFVTAGNELTRSTPWLGAAIGGLLALQIVSAMIWSLIFWSLRLAPTLGEAGYLALTTISALGGDEFGKSSQWRMLLPLASINGALLFGLSTAVMFRLVALFHLAEPSAALPVEASRASPLAGSDQNG